MKRVYLMRRHRAEGAGKRRKGEREKRRGGDRSEAKIPRQRKVRVKRKEMSVEKDSVHGAK